MADGPPTAEQLEKLKASVGTIAAAVASIDTYLCHLLATILHPPPSQDIDLASIIIFSQTTIERRINVVREILTLSLQKLLAEKRHTYEHKMGQFILTAFNKIASNATENLWVRNTAAHGMHLGSNPPKVIAHIFDREGVARLATKRPSTDGEMPGVTATEIEEIAAEIRSAASSFARVTRVMELLMWGPHNAAFQQAAAELGTGLKLKPPLPVRPHRQAKPKRAARKNGPQRAEEEPRPPSRG